MRHNDIEASSNLESSSKNRLSFSNDETFATDCALRLDSVPALPESADTMMKQIKFVTILVRDQKRALGF